MSPRLPLAARAKELAKGAAVPIVRALGAFRREPGRILLLLAHMRSGSSLLHHVLASNPTIFGRGERNKPYRTTWDLDRLVVDVCANQKVLPGKNAIFVDQVNHGRFTPNESILSHPRVEKIFLIREPFGAIGSLVHVLGKYYDLDLDRAVDYYVSRLKELRRYAEAEADKGHQFFLTYGDLVGERRAQVLRSLGEYLGLEQGLGEAYRTFSFTGMSGDPGEKIFSGRISGESREWPLDLDDGRRRDLRSVFDECVEGLGRTCLERT
jgi:hypothetical protein